MNFKNKIEETYLNYNKLYFDSKLCSYIILTFYPLGKMGNAIFIKDKVLINIGCKYDDLDKVHWDQVEDTILHEMVHIYVNMYFKDETESHGPNFILKANEIAKIIKIKEISSSDEADRWPIR